MGLITHEILVGAQNRLFHLQDFLVVGICFYSRLPLLVHCPDLLDLQEQLLLLGGILQVSGLAPFNEQLLGLFFGLDICLDLEPLMKFFLILLLLDVFDNKVFFCIFRFDIPGHPKIIFEMLFNLLQLFFESGDLRLQLGPLLLSQNILVSFQALFEFVNLGQLDLLEVRDVGKVREQVLG